MRRSIVSISLLVFVARALVACGEGRMERGLAAPEEEAVPIDPTEEKLTEEERRQQEAEEEDARAREQFEAAEDAGQDAE